MIVVALAERRGVRLVTSDVALRNTLRQFDWIVGPDDVLPEADLL